MSPHGIRDRVAIVGMGCTNFGEHWDKGLDDLIIDAASAAFGSAASPRNRSMPTGSAPPKVG
jgi:acetyl-CoA C-acetyltransferase